MYIIGDNTSEVLSGGAEADFLNGQGGNDALNGAEGNDHILGGSGNDRLTGADGNDKIEGGLGDDLIVGGSGAGNDAYLGGAGIDTVQYSSGSFGIVVDLAKAAASGTEIGTDTLSGVENITAGQGGDMITGSAGNNRLSGLGGADGLAGGAGKDVLIGGLGKDILSGQLGRDTFDFNSAAESTVANYDTITDFRHGQGDHVDLMSIDATSGGVNNIFLFAGTQSFAAFNATHDGGVVRAVAGVVEVDIGGNGTVDMVIKTLGVTLHADDFFL